MLLAANAWRLIQIENPALAFAVRKAGEFVDINIGMLEAETTPYKLALEINRHPELMRGLLDHFVQIGVLGTLQELNPFNELSRAVRSEDAREFGFHMQSFVMCLKPLLAAVDNLQVPLGPGWTPQLATAGGPRLPLRDAEGPSGILGDGRLEARALSKSAGGRSPSGKSPSGGAAPAAKAGGGRPPTLIGTFGPGEADTFGSGGIQSIEHGLDHGKDTWTIKGKLLPALNRKKIAPNYNRRAEWGSLRTKFGLDWHAAHLWGPGWGDEAAAGMLLAPRDINLKWQAAGAEKYLSKLHKFAAKSGVEVHVSARAVSQGPGVLNGKALGEASYNVTLVDPASGWTESAGQITISVGTPPFGKATEVEVTGEMELMGLMMGR